MLFIQVHSFWSLGVNSVISDYYGFSQVYFIPVIYEHLCWLVFTMSGFCHFGNLLRQHFSSVTVTFQKLSIYKQMTPSGSVTVQFSGSWTKGHSSRNFFKMHFWLLPVITLWPKWSFALWKKESPAIKESIPHNVPGILSCVGPHVWDPCDPTSLSLVFSLLQSRSGEQIFRCFLTVPFYL